MYKHRENKGNIITPKDRLWVDLPLQQHTYT